MTTTTVFYAIPGPPGGSLPELGPGSPTIPGVPLGQGIVVGTSSDATATFELRVVTDTTKAPVGSWTTLELLLALKRLSFFIRQRGFIGGSGGPSGNPPTNTIPVGSVPL